MPLKTLANVRVKEKRVLVRTGFDLPLDKQGKIKDDKRLIESLPTLQYLVKNKAKVIILSHNGRPEGKYVRRLAMDEVGKRLSLMLHRPVIKLNDCLGKEVQTKIAKMKPGQIILLENLRFHREEEENDISFARQLACLGDIYINDAFANCHRQHASMKAITRFLPAYAGFLVEKEVKILNEVMQHPRRPFVAIVGGAKISDKLKAIINLWPRIDAILIGGALANNILKAQGLQVGKSLIEPKMISEVKKLKLTDVRLKIPVDVVVASKISPKAKTKYRPAGKVKKNEIILDIGHDTINLYKMIIAKARQIIWAGPMGYFELPRFAFGSLEIAKAVASSRARTLAGGGDTLHVLEQAKLLNRLTFISTGGGAMLEFLEGKILPGLKPLTKK